jgi:hypothetical protein
MKDIKKLEGEMEYRREALMIIRNKDKLKTLSSTLHDNLLLSYQQPAGDLLETSDYFFRSSFNSANERANSRSNSRAKVNQTQSSTSYYSNQPDGHANNTNEESEMRNPVLFNRKMLSSAHARLTTSNDANLDPENIDVSQQQYKTQVVRVKSAISTFKSSKYFRINKQTTFSGSFFTLTFYFSEKSISLVLNLLDYAQQKL